jgi:hypothetical protein
VLKPPKALLEAIIAHIDAMGCGKGSFTIYDVGDSDDTNDTNDTNDSNDRNDIYETCDAYDVDVRAFATRFGPQLSMRLFRRGEVVPLWDHEPLVLPAFADAARIDPGGALGKGRVDVHTASGWRPTWTYPMSRHASLVAAARAMATVDVTDDECANGVRLFLRKRS